MLSVSGRVKFVLPTGELNRSILKIEERRFTYCNSGGTSSVDPIAGGTGSRSRHFTEMGCSPSQLSKSTLPQYTNGAALPSSTLRLRTNR